MWIETDPAPHSPPVSFFRLLFGTWASIISIQLHPVIDPTGWKYTRVQIGTGCNLCYQMCNLSLWDKLCLCASVCVSWWPFLASLCTLHLNISPGREGWVDYYCLQSLWRCSEKIPELPTIWKKTDFLQLKLNRAALQTIKFLLHECVKLRWKL